jgi:hypothetical protein
LPGANVDPKPAKGQATSAVPKGLSANVAACDIGLTTVKRRTCRCAAVTPCSVCAAAGHRQCGYRDRFRGRSFRRKPHRCSRSGAAGGSRLTTRPRQIHACILWFVVRRRRIRVETQLDAHAFDVAPVSVHIGLMLGEHPQGAWRDPGNAGKQIWPSVAEYQASLIRTHVKRAVVARVPLRDKGHRLYKF